MSEVARLPAAGLFRRLGGMVYDTLLVVAVLILATFPFLPFTDGKVLHPREVGSLAYLYWCWELLVIALFFGYFWTRKGQTVGMQAWRMRVETSAGRLLSWPQALQRLFYAALPWVPALLVLTVVDSTHDVRWRWIGLSLLGFGVLNLLAMLSGSHRLTWHDRMSGSRVVVLPKKR